VETEGYSGIALAAATLATICFPWLALIVALVALGNQTDPVKRSQLRTWAWASAIWFVVAFAAAILLATLP